MHSYLTEMLECPVCHGELAWTVTERRGNRIEKAEAHCVACAATYPVREGIGLFLTPDLPRNDLWEQVDSQLVQYLRENPEVERQLLDSPFDTLAPADQFFRALALEERGEYAQAKAAKDLANTGLYTPEHLACSDSQVNYALGLLSASDGPIVDLAAGLSALLFRRSALEHFASAGWQVDVANVCQAKARPTPCGVLLEGAGIDALPVAETMLEWCVFVAR